MKTCRDCQKEKPKEEFIKNHIFKDGIDTLCVVCNRKRVKNWRKKNPEKRKEQQKREGKTDYAHGKHLRWTFGITRQDYVKMFEEQKGCCAICGRHQLEFKRRLSVDHNHTTGNIRQLLCGGCNHMLGFAEENIERMLKGIEYLKKHSTGY